LRTAAARDDVEALVSGGHHDPFRLLGPHPVDNDPQHGWIVRAFLPEASSARLILSDPASEVLMKRTHSSGLFEARVPKANWPLNYRLELSNSYGHTWQLRDPYSFPPVLSDFDLHLLAEGSHLDLYERLGAHVRELNGVRGVHFAVWAPNATRVSVVGNFNHWDGRRHPMRLHPGVGIWEIFIPDIALGEPYKFEIKGRNGYLGLKSDPLAFYSELRPKSASVVWNVGQYAWSDDQWMRERSHRNALDAPMSIYEVHLGSWMRVPEEGHRWLSYREMAPRLVGHAQYLGITHIELMPVTEYPFDGSWGYQPIGYFAPTSRYGNPDDFAFFVDYCHQHGIGVILDWVPAHFPRDDHGLRYFDGSHLYEHSDPRQGEHPDWGTVIFNYGRREVSNFLLASALFWLDNYHIDGLRLDAVASMLYLDYSRQPGAWIPNQFGGRENLEAIAFLKRFNEVVHQRHPGVLTIAEESTAWPSVSRPTYVGGLGFSLKWNMGWMNDTLRYFTQDPIYRKYHHDLLTFPLWYAFTENFVLPLSHDEVVHGKGALLDKMPGDLWQRYANLRLLYGMMFTEPGKKLMFMGGEFGQWREWDHDESLDWHLLTDSKHHGLMRCFRDLNRLYLREPALHQVDFDSVGFEWIDFSDWEGSVVAYMRRARNADDIICVVCNFTPVVRENYRFGVLRPGYYAELINTDSVEYGGSNVGNAGGVMAEPIPWHGRPHSIALTVPPLSVVILKPT
jgi:1,4-alpha-glucan branching enzyme